MKVKCFSAMMAFTICFCIFCTPVMADGVPSFLKIGKTYYIDWKRDGNIKIIEIDKTGWIKVKHEGRAQILWINLSSVDAIYPED